MEQGDTYRRAGMMNLFPRDDADKRTDILSGGEASRLLFCKLMLQKRNVLVLDEPTNHLDLESIEAINIALQPRSGNRSSGYARRRLD